MTTKSAYIDQETDVELNRAWEQLKQEVSSLSGWQYMGSSSTNDGWEHHFRNRYEQKPEPHRRTIKASKGWTPLDISLVGQEFKGVIGRFFYDVYREKVYIRLQHEDAHIEAVAPADMDYSASFYLAKAGDKVSFGIDQGVLKDWNNETFQTSTDV